MRAWRRFRSLSAEAAFRPLRSGESKPATCEFTNAVHSSATPEEMDFLGKQGIPWEVFQDISPYLAA